MSNSITMDNARPDYADNRRRGLNCPGEPAPGVRESFEKEISEKREDGSEGQRGLNCPAEPVPGIRESFEKKMPEKCGDGSAGSEDNDPEDGRGVPQTLPSASSLLGALFENAMSAAAPAPPAAVENLGELVEDLVRRILVSDPKAGGPSEIRLQLNDAILPDTQIMMSRGPDGLLCVLLETGNASSMRTLVSAQQSLREQLEQHGPVNVRVNRMQESGQSDNDAHRRSQGLVEYSPETL